MDRHVEFVKDQILNQEKLAERFADQPHRAGLHLVTAARFREIISILERAPELRKDAGKKLNVVLADLEGLPSELMAELSISDSDKQEMLIESIIDKNGGVISLDKLLIEFYRRENTILKRNTLTSRLFRMAEKGMIFNVPSKRGYYSVYEMNEEDVARIFGRADKTGEEISEAPSLEASSEITKLENIPQPVFRMRKRVFVPNLNISAPAGSSDK